MCHTLEEFKKYLSYDPITGFFTNLKTGRITGFKNNKGYVLIRIEEKTYRAHRVAWLYMTGEWPVNEIDHDNRVRHDNRFGNLKEATKFENMQNMSINSNNSSGFRGVTFHKGEQKWMSRIGVGRKTIQLGYFATAELASKAYEEAKLKYHCYKPVV